MALSEHQHQGVLHHYDRMLPYLVQSFGGVPIVSGNCPVGLGSPVHWRPEGRHPLAHDLPVVNVPLSEGSAPYVELGWNSVLWMVHRYYSV